MKIAISGSACIGKSTLAMEMASVLQCGYIPEHYDLLFDRISQNQETPEALVELFNSALVKKVRDEREQVGFISDRCPIDLFNLWMAKGLWRREEDTRKFQKCCQHYTGYYDYIVLLPWGIFPLEQIKNTDDGQKRIMNKWVQMHNHANILGLTKLWVSPEKIIDLPKSAMSLENRVSYLRGQINDCELFK